MGPSLSSYHMWYSKLSRRKSTTIGPHLLELASSFLSVLRVHVPLTLHISFQDLKRIHSDQIAPKYERTGDVAVFYIAK